MKRDLLNSQIQDWRKLDGKDVLYAVLNNEANAGVAVSSSFGAESAVLLSLVAEIDPSTPILTVDTGKLFVETLRYREELVDHLGLTNVQIETSPSGFVNSSDPDGDLHLSNPDLCCQVRKVMPHALAAANYDILITGRKRHHGGGRAALPTANVEGQHIKINPLATWSQDQIEAHFEAKGLPRHPLVAEGFLSIGCETCTRRTSSHEAPRAGRWAGQNKTECGLHMSMNDTGATGANDSYQFELTEYGQ
ncbi:phosphoadenylyl-sulfate reductase [Magnetovibrio sp. PR-2]|uniref:phosphoadenylyl-sulfate reductase n=1 Tax=Magnetovibrio sp. PR-2 TaxID=3120356 RepID=UPI002FCDED9F